MYTLKWVWLACITSVRYVPESVPQSQYGLVASKYKAEIKIQHKYQTQYRKSNNNIIIVNLQIASVLLLTFGGIPGIRGWLQCPGDAGEILITINLIMP